MISSYFAGKRPRILMTLLASAAVATTGCSNMTSTASLGGVTAAAKVGGKIHGGNQPVAGATVNLYFASQQTFAAGASLVASTLSLADGAGSFSFTKSSTATANDGTSATFSCPSSGNPYVFVVAKGGTTVNTPSAGPNSDAEFIAPMGRCADINASTNIYMSEVVTVATMAAIHQYMNPTATGSPIESTIGSDGIFVSDGALSRSFDSVALMASLSTGLGNTSVTRTGDRAGAAGVTITITPELAKINQLANIISACINQTAGGSPVCSSIYSSAAPPADAGTTSVSNASYTFPTPDLLTALYNIFTNPTNSGTTNMTVLYNLSAASGAPYQPTLTSMPTDWSIGIKYVASGTCTNSSSVFISNPTSLAIDVSGNLLIGNASNNSTGSVAQLAASGVPAACFPVTVGGGIVPGTIPLTISGTVSDIAANVWVGSSSTNEIIRYTAPSPTAAAASLDIPTLSPVVAITTDGFGDVFFSTQSNDLYEIINGSSLTVPTVPVKINTISLGSANHIMIDSANRIWASSGAGFITATAGSPDPSNTFLTNFTTTQVNTPNSYGIASTSAAGNGVYMSSLDGTITYLAAANGGFAPVSPFPVSGGGISNAYDIALDGAQNVWTANGGGGIAAFSKFGNALTPATGFQKDPSFLGGQNALVIDASGNIWLGLTNSNTITEIVGAAVPVYQPYATGLQPVTNRFQTLP